MLTYTSVWSLSDVQAVRDALNTLPADIRAKLDTLVLDITDPDADAQQNRDDGEMLYMLVQTDKP